MKANEICTKAADLVGGDRAVTHGDKEKNFHNIATLWNAFLATRANPVARISALDVGLMLALLKIARTQTGSNDPDNFVDGAGYFGCAGEIAGKQ